MESDTTVMINASDTTTTTYIKTNNIIFLITSAVFFTLFTIHLTSAIYVLSHLQNSTDSFMFGSVFVLVLMNGIYFFSSGSRRLVWLLHDDNFFKHTLLLMTNTMTMISIFGSASISLIVATEYKYAEIEHLGTEVYINFNMMGFYIICVYFAGFVLLLTFGCYCKNFRQIVFDVFFSALMLEFSETGTYEYL